jgi:hypothetical protein
MPHIDDVGLATVSTVMTGSKWWVMMRPSSHKDVSDHRGDLYCSHAFPLSWDAVSTGKEFLEAEAIHLKKGDAL